MSKANFSEPEIDDIMVTLYNRHAPELYRYIYRQTSQPQDAEDVLLEVFTIALRYEELFDLTPQRQLAWLQRVARRKVIDAYRRQSRRLVLPLDDALEILDGESTPEEQALSRETYQYLYAALAQLPPAQRQLIQLRYGDGLRFAEIAMILKQSEGSLRKMLSRILRHLRIIYTHHQGEAT